MQVAVLLTACIVAVIHAELADEVSDVFPPVDLSGTDFSVKFCMSAGKRCPGGDIKVVKAAILNHCKAKCLRHDGDELCKSTYWDPVKRLCYLKSHRCAVDELEDADGVDMYRRKKDERCNKERPQYKRPDVYYTPRFCEKRGVVCKRGARFRRPRVLPTVTDCIDRCILHRYCAGVDYNSVTRSCQMRAEYCGNEYLKPDPNNVNYIRSEIGETSCPPERTMYPATPPEPRVECLDPDLYNITFAPVDLNGTDFSLKFCITDGKRCPGGDIKVVKAAILNHCKAECLRHDGDELCKSTFWDPVNKLCYLKSHRCALSKLEAANGVDLYRIKKEERCPKSRPLYKRERLQFLLSFCKRVGVVCAAGGKFRKAQIQQNVDDCINRCSLHRSCAGADYNTKTGNCQMRVELCSDADLTVDENNVNYIRLVEGKSVCPANRTKHTTPKRCPDPGFVPEPRN